MNDDDVTEWMEPLFKICITFAMKSRGSLDEFGNMSSRISWTTCAVYKIHGMYRVLASENQRTLEAKTLMKQR